MYNKKDLEKILPHKHSMILLNGISEYSEDKKFLKAFVIITNENIFFDKEINGVDSTIGIEFMAQAIGCYAFLRKKLKEPKIGFLLGTRLYNNKIEKFENGKKYDIIVKEVFVADIYSFECFIYNENMKEVASATINVFQSDNDNLKELANV